MGVSATAYEGVALVHLSLRERSTRVSAAGEGLRLIRTNLCPLTLASLDLSPPGRGEAAVAAVLNSISMALTPPPPTPPHKGEEGLGRAA